MQAMRCATRGRSFSGDTAVAAILRRPRALGTMEEWNERLISREELTAYLFAVQDMKEDLRTIRELLEGGDNGQDDA
jgi:hypothetical protein